MFHILQNLETNCSEPTKSPNFKLLEIQYKAYSFALKRVQALNKFFLRNEFIGSANDEQRKYAYEQLAKILAWDFGPYEVSKSDNVNVPVISATNATDAHGHREMILRLLRVEVTQKIERHCINAFDGYIFCIYIF